jgi:uncharacterized protein (UPF0332 family)
MKPESMEYVRYRISRAETTLQLARLALDNGFLYDAINRLYFACFFAVSALLLAEGHSSSKHKGVQSLFSRYWIQTGKLPASMGRFFHRLYEHRQKSDYTDLTTFEPSDVELWCNEAHAFVESISEEVRKLMSAATEGD